MKRKVIKLGSNSLLVSLPSAWAKKHNIRKGDEISLEEKDGTIVLSGSSAHAPTSASIDITNLKAIVKRALGALYKKGYDEFTIQFSNHDELEAAYEVIREEFTGFEIVQHGKNHLVAREISQPHADQFDTVLRRQFMVIKDFAGEVSSALASKDTAWLKRLVLRDKDVNKLADFCRRIINKQQTTGISSALYLIVDQLEKIGDRYKEMSAYAADANLAPSKQLLQAVAKVNAYVDQFYHCFYQFSLPALNAFAARDRELRAELHKLRVPAQEQRILFLLEDIIQKTFDLNGPLMILKL